MGFRNPFRFAVDRSTGWVYLGDYGPDAGGADPNRGPGGQVEFNLIKAPGNYGWPYCHGRNDAYNDYDFATGVSRREVRLRRARRTPRPRNTGLVDLPPARPAWIAYDDCNVPQFGCGSESPMGGPTYHFDASQPVQDEVPRLLRRQELRLRVRPRLDPARSPATNDGRDARRSSRSWTRFDFKQLINIEFGPDGSLYVLDYGTGYFAGDANSRRLPRRLRAGHAHARSPSCAPTRPPAPRR